LAKADLRELVGANSASYESAGQTFVWPSFLIFQLQTVPSEYSRHIESFCHVEQSHDISNPLSKTE